MECTEIKKLWPVHNKALKRYEAKYGLYDYEARSGYRYLSVGKLAPNQACIEAFHSQYDGVNALLSLAQQLGIDHRFCNYGTDPQGNLSERNTTDLPDVVVHNELIQKAIDTLQKSKKSYAIVDKGRTADERSCIWVEKGHFYGMGYIGTDLSITCASEIKDYVTPYKGNYYMMQLVASYADKYPGKVLRHNHE